MTDPWEREYKRIQRRLREILDDPLPGHDPLDYVVNRLINVCDDMELTRRRLVRAEYPKEK